VKKMEKERMKGMLEEMVGAEEKKDKKSKKK
jgi:hypothetical protein